MDRKKRFSALFVTLTCACALTFSLGALSACGNSEGAEQGTGGTMWYCGNAAPESALGTQHDFYINTTTGEVYQRGERDWTIIFTLKGKDGADGADGKDGKDGKDGTFWHVGDTEPIEAGLSEAKEGDFYFRTFGEFSGYDGYQIYRRTASNWEILADMATERTPEEEENRTEYHIRGLSDLKQFREAVKDNNFSGKTVYLSADIDLSSEENWEPIGEFRGIFDGKKSGTENYTISNLKIDRDEDNVGLFSSVPDGTVKNVDFCNVNIKGRSNVGTLAGYAFTVDEISNVNVGGNIQIEGSYKVGGITGGSYGKITDCTVDGGEGSFIKGVYHAHDLEGDCVGGIIGYTGELNHLTDSICGDHVRNVTVSGTRKVGGVVGYLHYGQGVKECSFEDGTVESNADEGYVSTNGVAMIAVGGIVGQTHGSGTAQKISSCSVSGVTIKVPRGFTYETECRDGVKLTSAILGNARDCNTESGAAHARTIVAEENAEENVTYEAKLNGVAYAHYANAPTLYIASVTVYSPQDLLSVAALQAEKDNNVFNHANAGENHTVVNFSQGEYDLAGKNWTPLDGFRYDYFGNGAIVKNMTMTAAQWRGGFVGSMGDCTVKDFTFDGATVLGEQVGVVAGHSDNGTIENVRLTGNLSVSYSRTAQNETYPALGAILGVVAAGANFGGNVTLGSEAQLTLDYGEDFTTECEKFHGFSVGFLAGAGVTLTGVPTEEEGAKILVKNLPEVDAASAGTELRPDDGIQLSNGVDLTVEGGSITLKHTAFNHFDSTEGILSGNITFKNVRFIGNRTATGTGYALTLGFDSTAHVLFDGCTFENMYCAAYILENNSAEGAHVTVKDCTFNDTSWGVGLSVPANKDQTVFVTFEGTNNGLPADKQFETLG